jgi:hypothetical protein
MDEMMVEKMVLKKDDVEVAVKVENSVDMMDVL